MRELGTSNSRDLRGALLAANAVAACASAVFAVVGFVRPGYVQPASSAGSVAKFWAASSAVRTLAVTGPLLVGMARGERLAPDLLFVAGMVQLMDAGLGVWQRKAPMAVMPVAAGLVHLASARVLTTTTEGHSRVR